MHGILIRSTEGELHSPFFFRDALVLVPTHGPVVPNPLQSNFLVSWGFLIRCFKTHLVNDCPRNTTHIVALFRSSSLSLWSILYSFDMCFVIKNRRFISIQVLFRHPMKKK